MVLLYKEWRRAVYSITTLQIPLSVSYIDELSLHYLSLNSMPKGVHRFSTLLHNLWLFIEEALSAVCHVLIFIQVLIPSWHQNNGDCLRKLYWNLQLLLNSFSIKSFLYKAAEPYVERRPQCSVLYTVCTS